MAEKIKRLSKVARELNVAVPTLVDFLNSQGIEIESSPNTKLNPEHYEILSKEFAADQSLKEEVKKKGSLKNEKKETISLKTVEEEKDGDGDGDGGVDENIIVPEIEITPEIEVAHPIKKQFEEDVKPSEIPQTEKQEDETETVVEKPITEKEEEETPPEKHTPEERKTVGLNIIGSIDLSKIDSNTRPIKRKKETDGNQVKTTALKDDVTNTEKKDEEISKSEEISKEKDHQEKTPIISQKQETIKQKEEKVEKIENTEVISPRPQKLPGLTIVGKMELKEPEKKKKEKEKEKDADADKKTKRKRKRVKRDFNIEKPGDKKAPHFSKGKKKPEPKVEISEKDIQKEIKETLARLADNKKSKASKNRRAKREIEAEKREKERVREEKEESILKLTEFVSVSELATMMSVQPTEVIAACMSLGIFASINQRLDAETIQIVADEFGFEVEFVSADVQDLIPIEEDNPEDLVPRPPIITVMGHVDHGKTSLLDYIRHAKTTKDEAGGITQHIGAYSVEHKDRYLTFLDTPGHEAFTAMRARGAQVTDVAIIIVAADDDVMPQTKEAISHAQAAGVPMVFAINKIDKQTANSDKIREQLSSMNILVEEWGGKYQSQEISAKKGTNIEELIEKVILEADLLDLKANPNKNATGTVLESSLDKGKGYVTNILVENGTLKVGDIVLVGKYSGRVRAMLNEKGKNLTEALPSTPISILGINGAPSAGDKFYVMNDEREARNIAMRREQLYREQGLRTQKHITLDEIGRRLAIGDFKELNLIVKGDVDGSIEALSDSLLKLSTDEIQINIVHKAVGAITEADVNLASASEAIIIGFQVRPTTAAKRLASDEQIDIRLYSVIYKAIDELKSAVEGMLSPDIKEEIVGTAEVRETFNISKVGTIAGCFVTSGYIQRTSLIRIIRDGIVVHEGKLGSLKRFKDDVKEVKNNYECGLNIANYNDMRVGDIIEAYEEREVARKL